MHVTKEETQKIISQIDSDNNNKISYTEFIAACISSHIDIYNGAGEYNLEALQSIFDEFDIDHNGFITRSELELSFAKLGYSHTKEDIDEIMKKHDLNVDGKISFDEFVAMMDSQNANENTEIDEDGDKSDRVREKVII